MSSDKNILPWTAVVVTSCSLKWANAIRSELVLLQKKGTFPKETHLLSVEDPEIKVGSGGATLNALLVAVEHLSAKRGFSVLTSNVLFESRILIIHNGRSSVYASCGKAFLQLPSRASTNGYQTNLEALVGAINHMAIELDNRYGVWVCSTDMLLRGNLSLEKTSKSLKSSDCIIFCSLGSESDGVNHGVIQFGENNFVKNIYYRQNEDVVRSCQLSQHGKAVPIVMGIVYISPELSESLTSLHSFIEAISCTHLGVDSGSDPIQVSLFFDILTAISSDVTEKDFVEGACGVNYNSHNDYPSTSNRSQQQFRQLVWKCLRPYRSQAVLLPQVCKVYLWDNLDLKHYVKSINYSSSSNVSMNSCVERIDNGLTDTFIENCVLIGNSQYPLTIGSNIFLSGLVIKTEIMESNINLLRDMAYLCLNVENSTLGAAQSVCVYFGMSDNIYLPFTSSSFCNRPWSEFFENSGIKTTDVWPEESAEVKSLFNAALYPIGVGIVDILTWLSQSKKIPDWWSTTRRLSLKDILQHLDLGSSFKQRKLASLENSFTFSRKVLNEGENGSLLNMFQVAFIEGWHLELLEMLDNLAEGICDHAHNFHNLTRILANIADLLDCMANGDGGVRSGPASNKDWIPALSYFEKNDKLSVKKGILELKSIRANWMTDPRRIIRAARHYEGAAQYLIRQNVMTAKSFLFLENRSFPEMEQWVTCECPARIDLYGGWTDTPPICYELGGSVVNAAILVNGKKPIGAKVKRISDPVIIIFLDEENQLVLKDKEHLSDFNQPLSQGALVKACLLCTKIVDLDTNELLEEQLISKFSGGFYIETWSDLPKGSGLGTSSILAAAILSCLWTASGKSYTRSSIIHAVLCVEQMLTTGGGWQDQVGGLMGGIAHGVSKANLPLFVEAKSLQLSPEIIRAFRSRLILIYTGKVRLAKNLLQDVLRNWFARDSTIFETFRCLLDHSYGFVNALLEGDFVRVGHLMNEYWSLKKILAAGAEPPSVKRVMKELENYVHGAVLCGAGGGGFMVALAKENITKKQLEVYIQNAQATGMEIYDVDLDEEGLKVTIGQEVLMIE